MNDHVGQISAQQILDTDDYLGGSFGGQRLATPQPRWDELPLA